MEALHGTGGSDPLVPTCQASSFAVVASALQGHPGWPLNMLGVDAQVWRESAQLLTHHNHLLATDYWADMWSWRQVRPDKTAWREVGLAHYWPDANEERQDVRMGQTFRTALER